MLLGCAGAAALLAADRASRYMRGRAYAARRPGRPAVLITGAASGIGLATAETFARAGWFVGLSDVDGEALAAAAGALAQRCGLAHPDAGGAAAAAPAAAAAAAAAPAWCCCCVADAADEGAMVEALARFRAASPLGRLDVVFCCAGLLRVGLASSATPPVSSAAAQTAAAAAAAAASAAAPVPCLGLAEQRRQLRVNVEGVLVTARAAHGALAATPGSVLISMASVSAGYGVPTHAVYSASKHAVRALTEALSLELQPDGIRVLDVWVGLCNSRLTSAFSFFYSLIHSLTHSSPLPVATHHQVGYVATPMVDGVPKQSVMLRNEAGYAAPASVARAVWAAVQEDADPRTLHVMADAGTWVADKLMKLDALLGLGVSRVCMQRFVMPSPSPPMPSKL